MRVISCMVCMGQDMLTGLFAAVWIHKQWEHRQALTLKPSKTGQTKV